MAADPADSELSLDQHVKHVLTPRLEAVGSAVGLVYADTQALRREVRTIRDRVIDVAATQQEHSGVLGRHTETLAGHSRRLDDLRDGLETVERVQIEHGAALAELAGKVSGMAAAQDRHGKALASHGEMLQEILRRLPPADGGKS